MYQATLEFENHTALTWDLNVISRLQIILDGISAVIQVNNFNCKS
jgi:hypothetical protein